MYKLEALEAEENNFALVESPNPKPAEGEGLDMTLSVHGSGTDRQQMSLNGMSCTCSTCYSANCFL